MTYTFGDNLATGRRAWELGHQIADAADRLGKTPALDVRPEDADVVYTLYGWWRFVVRSSRAYWLAWENGYSVESLPLVRNILDHTVSMMWLHDGGELALTVVWNAGETHRNKLIRNVVDTGWHTAKDLETTSSPLALIPTPDENDPTYPAYQKLLGEFTHVDQLMAAYGRSTDYPVYRTLSAYSHASAQSANRYLEMKDGQVGVRLEPQRTDSHGPIIHIAMALIQAGDVISSCLARDPLRQLLERAARDIGLGAPELLRAARKKALPTNP
ncbi:DUF5677 domain-containing protein [Microbispora bryophytorum]|uniref:DUF5677 domain-containing protein n=1 Tax=Microbispora bryophytorum TaxID=1460882 RepID=UPI0037161FCA